MLYISLGLKCSDFHWVWVFPGRILLSANKPHLDKSP